MAHQFAPKMFLRFTSNALLSRYFQSRSLLAEIHFDALDELEIDSIYAAWHDLSPEDRASVEIDFAGIDDLATNEGIRTVAEQAALVGVRPEQLFGEAEGHHDKAMLAFLDFPAIFDVALQFIQTDALPDRNWFKRRDLPETSPKSDADSIALLASSLRYYFTENEGRGHSCTVDCLERDGRSYYFAYPEDYGGRFLEYGERGFQRIARRPAFEIVFIVDAQECTLDISYSGTTRTKRDLQTIFARIILGIDLHASPKSEQIYDLNKLKDRSLVFVFDRSKGITDVTIHKLRFTVLGGIKRRITLEADATRKRGAVHDLVEDVFDSSASASLAGRLPLAAFNVTQAQIRVRFYPLPGRRAQTRTFQLSYPNGCPLKYEGNDLLIRHLLRESGLEHPSVPAQHLGDP